MRLRPARLAWYSSSSTHFIISVGVLPCPAPQPPLTVMSYYEVTDEQRLRRQRTELTDQPENL